jgi:hypothetical protein
MPFSGAAYDPETVKLMTVALDDVSKNVGPQSLVEEVRKDMAERILSAVAAGERDPERLKMAALGANGA